MTDWNTQNNPERAFPRVPWSQTCLAISLQVLGLSLARRRLHLVSDQRTQKSGSNLFEQNGESARSTSSRNVSLLTKNCAFCHFRNRFLDKCSGRDHQGEGTGAACDDVTWLKQT